MLKQKQEIEIYKNKETKNEVSKNGFLSGVLMLSLSAIIVKIIGLVYKIPMLRLLGSEGMGYFNSAYEIYALLCVISTAGLPIAMSVMISKNCQDQRVEKIFRISMRLFMILGIAGSLAMLIFSYPFARFLGGDKSFYCILAISPTLFFICITSAYRGYFQGLSQMMPTAVSQVIEALGKLILGIIFAWTALGAGFDTEAVAAFAVLGLVVGSVLSSVYLFLTKRKISSPCCLMDKISSDNVMRELLKTAIPVTLSAAVISLTKIVDMTMILKRLQGIGYESEEAFSVYGSYTTMCLPLFSLAPALISSVAMPLVPKLSRAIADRDDRKQTETVNDGIKWTSVISMPVSVGLALYSKEILGLIFKNESGAIELCAPLLTVLALSIPLSCLVTLGNSVLQAYGRPRLPVISMGVGVLAKIVLAYFLIGNIDINIMGAPISTFFCDLVINILSFYYICRMIPEKIKILNGLILPFISAFIAVGASKVIYGMMFVKYGESSILTLMGVASAAILYALLCVMLRVINIKEIKNTVSRDS